MPFEVPARIGHAAPDSARLAAIRKTFAESAAPVRPLPSNAVIMAFCLGVFIALGVILAAPIGFAGLANMSAGARWMDYSVLLLLALALAGVIVEQMIPGSRHTMRPVWGIVLAIVLLSLTSLVLFPDFDTNRFVPRGMPCLRYGLLSSIRSARRSHFRRSFFRTARRSRARAALFDLQRRSYPRLARRSDCCYLRCRRLYRLFSDAKIRGS